MLLFNAATVRPSGRVRDNCSRPTSPAAAATFSTTIEVPRRGARRSTIRRTATSEALAACKGSTTFTGPG